MRSYESWRDLAPALKTTGKVWLYVAEFGLILALYRSELALPVKILVWLVGTVFLGAGGSLFFSTGRRLEVEEGLVVLERDRRAPVIYLRPFAFDRTSITADVAALESGTAEDLYGRLLAGLGPAIAVGRPHEPLPPMGFPRLYVQDQFWVQCVTEFMQKSRLVLLQYGGTPGLQTEMEIAFSMDPRRLLLAFPGQPQWEHFRAAHGGRLRHGLPLTKNPVALLGFTEDWTPRVVAEHEETDFGNPYRAVPGYVAGVPPADSPRWSWSRAGYWPFSEPRRAPAISGIGRSLS